jgi:hypothetical protein
MLQLKIARSGPQSRHLPHRRWSEYTRASQRAPVAQRIEHLTTDQKVRGSNPFGRAGDPVPAGRDLLRFRIGEIRAAADIRGHRPRRVACSATSRTPSPTSD